MKTILVLTDFSKNATHAAAEALTLSGKLHADLLLFNTYITYPTAASYAGADWVAEEFAERQTQSKLALEMLTEGLESLSNELDEGDRIPSIYWQSEDCDLAYKVNEICRHKNIELIVMGTRADNPGDFLYGEDTDAVIQHAKRPVLILPAKTNIKHIRKIVFATDFDDADIYALHQLIKLGSALHWQIDVVHVVRPGNEDDTEHGPKHTFFEAFAKLNYQGQAYHELSGTSVIAKLQHICNENRTGLLAMLHHQHSLFARLFKHSKTKEILINQKLPLLVFPSSAREKDC